MSRSSRCFRFWRKSGSRAAAGQCRSLRMVQISGLLLRYGFAGGGLEQDLCHQQHRAYHDGTIGDVKRGPVVAIEIEVEEVDDVSREEPVPQIPNSSAKDERQRA